MKLKVTLEMEPAKFYFLRDTLLSQPMSNVMAHNIAERLVVLIAEAEDAEMRKWQAGVGWDFGGEA